VSLAERRTPPPGKQVPPGRPEGRDADERRARWAGLLLVAAGLLLMSPSVAEALAPAMRGTAGGDELRGSAGDEEIMGGGSADELHGGAGGDVLLAGPGDDFVAAADGEQDLVLCGPGADTVSVDPADLVSRDCETVYPD
jgi:Ca2+-binding RTX toxin-like protein